MSKKWQVGDITFWAGKRVLIVDLKGYASGQTADLRWTVSGVSGSKDEVSGHKRGVPVAELSEVPEAT